MKPPKPQRWQFAKYLAYLLGATLLCACLLSVVLTYADASGPAVGPAWAAPGAMALKQISPATVTQNEPNLLSNLDCTLVDYRTAASSAMQAGCFTPTGFGLLDSDNDTVIFNGTDEGLPLLPYSAHQALVPWPGALDLVALEPVSTGGSYVSLYQNPLASLQDQHNSLGQLSAKQLVEPSDLSLDDPDGKPLVINPQTMAFSDNGSWLVVETLGGSFVRINLATLDVMAFAPAFGSQGSPALLKSQVAVSSDGRYVAIGNDSAPSLKVYDLGTCDGIVAGLRPQNCSAHDYLPFARQQIAGLQSVRHLRFVNDGLLSLEARTSTPAGGGVYELAPTGSITSLIDYLALGDSYTSGEGAFDYLAGTDTADNMCHLSADSYPLLLTRDLFGAAGGHSVACSGAVINDVGSTSQNYRGQVREGATLDQLQQAQSALLSSIMTDYLPGYVAQQQFVRQYQPATITVSVGGNDIGFGDILQNCVEPHVSLHPSDNTCYNTYESRAELARLIDRTVPSWTALYKQVLAEAPGTRVYAIGYPEVATDTGDCALNVHLNKSELEFAEGLIDYLDGSIRQAASNAGVTYVDISQALAGHRLCEAAGYDVAVNGLTAGTDGKVLGVPVLGKESYHPNALGQALIEQAILRQTHNLASATPAPAGSPDSQGLLAAPKTGRTVNTIVPDDSLTTGPTRSGMNLAVRAGGARDGLRPNTAYTISLDGPGGTVVGTAASDDAGDISAGVTLPDGTASGSHTIDLTGRNQADEPVDVTQPIYVPASGNDADGDGIPDILDTCPGAANSGQDSDRDGIDDTCDGFIGPQPTAAGPGGPISGANSGQTDANSSSTGGGTATQTAGAAADANLGTTGNTLNTQLLTIVTGFTLNRDSGSGPPAGQAANNTGAAPRVLGAATAKAKPIGHRRPFAKLQAIGWLPWALLPIIIWLLVLLGLGVRHLTRRRVKTAYFTGQKSVRVT